MGGEEEREHNVGRNIMRNCLTANKATFKKRISQLNLRANNIGFCVHRPSKPSSVYEGGVGGCLQMSSL